MNTQGEWIVVCVWCGVVLWVASRGCLATVAGELPAVARGLNIGPWTSGSTVQEVLDEWSRVLHSAGYLGSPQNCPQTAHPMSSRPFPLPPPSNPSLTAQVPAPPSILAVPPLYPRSSSSSTLTLRIGALVLLL